MPPGVQAPARTVSHLLCWRFALTLVLVAPGAHADALARSDQSGPDAFWAAHIEPLLKQHCAECHSATKTKSGLDLTSLQTILRGGERGPAVIPGRPDESHLYTFLRADADPHMPPGSRKTLAEEEVALVRRWIEKLGAAATSLATNEIEASQPSRPLPPRIDWKPPPDMPAANVVDRFLELAWKLDKITAAPRAADHIFVRRAYLDLLGRIPTRPETERFLQASARDKRPRLIDELLANDEFPRHMREIFDPVLMERRGPRWEDQRANQKWFAWLEDAFRRNRPWNEVVREIIVARPDRPEDRGSAWFLYERENNAQAMAEALAPVVFGVQVKCAQCHDHMVAREIKQAHYWGMVAAFNRSKNVDTPTGPALAESAIGGFVSFANLKKESQPARMVFFNGRAVDEPWPKEGAKEIDSPDLYLVPPPPAAEKPEENRGRRRRDPAVKAEQAAVPKFSRRQAFADAVTRENPLLGRAMVNRVWAILFGRGLVHPVDLMDSKHPPSHPELLEWLAADFERSHYDVQRLFQTLAKTRAYQLDSRAPKGPRTLRPGAFAQALDKPLSAEQLFRSLLVATANAADTNGMVCGRSETELRRAFIKEFPDLFPAEYNATLQQAMFLSNSELFDALLTARDGNLVARLAASSTPEGRVREAFAAIFGREPDAEERRECVHYLQDRSPEAGARQLVWAMLTSAEFQLNH